LSTPKTNRLKAATVDAVIEVADQIGVPAAQVAVAWLLRAATSGR